MKIKNKASFSEIIKLSKSPSLICFIDNIIASYVIFYVQRFNLSANKITIASLVSVLLAVSMLLFYDNKIFFISMLFISITLDNMDGIWARLKKQTSEFGKFFDGFMDCLKYFILDLSLIVFYFESMEKYFPSEKLFLLAVSIFFIVKALFYLSNFDVPSEEKDKKMKVIAYPNPAERYLLVYPLAVFFEYFFFFYILAIFAVYIPTILFSIRKRFNFYKID